MGTGAGKINVTLTIQGMICYAVATVVTVVTVATVVTPLSIRKSNYSTSYIMKSVTTVTTVEFPLKTVVTPGCNHCNHCHQGGRGYSNRPQCARGGIKFACTIHHTSPTNAAGTVGNPTRGPSALQPNKPYKTWRRRGSNPGPSACEADVIPLHHIPDEGHQHRNSDASV